MRTNRLCYLTLALVFWGWAFSYAASVTVDDIAQKLSCYCGTCPHLVVSDCGCSTADQIKADVKKMIQAGMTEDQILNAYVAQHGQTVLAAPPARGFNLTAWLIPFAGFLVGATALAVYLKRQRKDDDDPQNANGKMSRKTPEEYDEYYREQLKKELEQRK